MGTSLLYTGRPLAIKLTRNASRKRLASADRVFEGIDLSQRVASISRFAVQQAVKRGVTVGRSAIPRWQAALLKPLPKEPAHVCL